MRMLMRVVLAFDKFKGAFSALEACRAAARGLHRLNPQIECDLVPIADGGEGTVDAVTDALRGERRYVEAHDALGRPVSAGFCVATDRSGRRIAVVEMSATSGLWRLTPDDRDPWRASTFGVGEMIRAADNEDVEQIIVGLGGSATNDGGCGMAQAIGWRFLDELGREIVKLPEMLSDLRELVPPTHPIRAPLVVACDVTNPLLGPEGATRIYGPQKGVATAEMAAQEERLRWLADVVEKSLGRGWREVPGAGAAGGLGFGLMAFCGAELRPGFGMIAEIVGLRDRMRGADLVITGEGALDAQTASGKGPLGVAMMAREAGVPVIGFAGLVRLDDMGESALLRACFDHLREIRPPGCSVEASIRAGSVLLEEAIVQCEDLRARLAPV